MIIAFLVGALCGMVLTALWHHIDNADEPAE